MGGVRVRSPWSFGLIAPPPCPLPSKTPTTLGFLPQLLQLALGSPRPPAPSGRVGCQATSHLMLYSLLPGPPHLGLLPLFLLLPLPGPQQVSWVGGRGKAERWEKSAGNRSLMEAQGQVGSTAQRARGLGNGVCHGSRTGWRLPLGAQLLGPAQAFSALPGSLLPIPASGVPQL